MDNNYHYQQSCGEYLHCAQFWEIPIVPILHNILIDLVVPAPMFEVFKFTMRIKWLTLLCLMTELSFSSNYPQRVVSISKNMKFSGLSTKISIPSKCTQPDAYQCVESSQCIPVDELCDFFENCPQKDDEQTCPSDCDFENNSMLCQWTTSDNDENADNIFVSVENSESAKNKTRFHPTFDASHNPNGHFMIIYPGNFTTKVGSKNAYNVYTFMFSTSAPSCRLSFDYYVATDNAKASSVYKLLIIDITDEGITESELIQINAQNVEAQNKWLHHDIGLGYRDNFDVGLRRIENGQMDDSLAIDNVRFENCSFTKPHNYVNKSACTSDQFTCSHHMNCIDQGCNWNVSRQMQ